MTCCSVLAILCRSRWRLWVNLAKLACSAVLRGCLGYCTLFSADGGIGEVSRKCYVLCSTTITPFFFSRNLLVLHKRMHFLNYVHSYSVVVGHVWCSCFCCSINRHNACCTVRSHEHRALCFSLLSTLCGSLFAPKLRGCELYRVSVCDTYLPVLLHPRFQRNAGILQSCGSVVAALLTNKHTSSVRSC